MQLARLRPIELQRRVALERGSPYEPPETWVTERMLWADVIPLSVSGRAAYQQVAHSQATHVVRLRGRHAISLGQHRFRWRGQILAPVEPAVDPDGTGRWTTVTVELQGDS
uniref:Head-tail adaptor protein n=2 Tax=Thermorudis TaxID=1649508 RepID=A0A7C2WJ32_9BACT